MMSTIVTRRIAPFLAFAIVALAGSAAALACTRAAWVEDWWVDRDWDRVEATFGLAVDCGGDGVPCSGTLIWEAVVRDDGGGTERRQAAIAWNAAGAEVLYLSGRVLIPLDAEVVTVRVVRVVC